MSADRDTTRIVRSWLRTDEHESADRVLDHVLTVLDTTPQRRSWWPARRFADMSTLARIGIAAAAVVVVAVVGINLLPVGNGAGGGPAVTASPSPTPTPSPSPSPPPSATPVAFPPDGDLAVGTRHTMTLAGKTFSFSVPSSGWYAHEGFGIDRRVGVVPEGAGFIFWTHTPVGVFADPCAHTTGPEIAPSAAELAAAVAKVPGTDLVSGPTDVTVGGYPAKQVVVTVREDVACVPSEFYLWYAPVAGEARYASALGSTIRVWIIDVDGTLVWFDGETYKGAGPEPGRAIQQIVDSIQFE